jgi:hypothetical protein
MVMSMILGLYGVIWISIEIHFIDLGGSYPVPSWKEIHDEDSQVTELPMISLGPEAIRHTYIIWWGIPGGALLFFLLFGMNYEVYDEYVKFWAWFRTRVLKRPIREKAITMPTIHPEYVPFLFRPPFKRIHYLLAIFILALLQIIVSILLPFMVISS